MLLVGEYPCISCFHPPILIERLHATHETSRIFLSKLLSKLPLIMVFAKSRLQLGLQVRSKTETKPNFGFKIVCEEQSVNFSFEIQIFL